jgi:hypothetical protein
VNNHGEKIQPAHADPGLAAAALVVFAHRHEVIHLLYSAVDEADAVRRIANLLQLSESVVGQVVAQPLAWMLPQSRADLELASTSPSAPELATPRNDLATTPHELAADGRSTA